VHADTHGQSASIFGLAYIIGIQLMPRIRNWKHLTLYRPTKDVHYQHIDSLFSATVDWDLIAMHLLDMLRVGVSIAAGTITPSTILRRLGTYSRKNRLYLARRHAWPETRCWEQTGLTLRIESLARDDALRIAHSVELWAR
jgi:TnpA family transposase